MWSNRGISMMFRRWMAVMTTIVAMGCAQNVMAAVTFQVKAPRLVGSDERFRIEFVVSDGRGDNFNGPSFSGLDVLAGPSVSSGTYINIVNGKQTTSSSQTYTYVVQAIEGVNKARVSGASIRVDGRTMSTSDFTIDIVAGGARGGSQAGGSAGSRNGRTGGASGRTSVASDDILLRMEVDRKNVYQGEAVTATLRLYSRVGIAGLDSPKYPSFNGFWSQDLEAPRQEQPRRENIGGKLYESQPVRQWLLYPQKSGTLTIEQCEFTALAQIITQNESSGNSLFDEFFGGGSSVETIKRKIISPAIKIQVKELPKPAPDGFNGAVGRFSFETSISGKQIEANASGFVTMKVSGSGNFPLLEAPQLTLPQTIEQYPAKANEQISYTAAGGSGSLEWEVPFIARAQGDYQVEVPSLVYFNPTSGRYETAQGKNFDLKVSPDRSGGALIAGSNKEDLKMLGQDIRFIKLGDSKLTPHAKWMVHSIEFYGILLLELLAFGTAMYLMRRRIELRKDTVRLKNKTANRVALKRLKTAKSFMAQGQRSEFFKEALRALWGYMGDKLNLAVAELNRQNIESKLIDRGVGQATIAQILDLVDRCEMAQYLSAGQNEEMEPIYAQTIDAISKLEKEI